MCLHIHDFYFELNDRLDFLSVMRLLCWRSRERDGQRGDANCEESGSDYAPCAFFRLRNYVRLHKICVTSEIAVWKFSARSNNPRRMSDTKVVFFSDLSSNLGESTGRGYWITADIVSYALIDVRATI